MRSVAIEVRSPRISSTVASGLSVTVSKVNGFQFLICIAPGEYKGNYLKILVFVIHVAK